MSKPEAEISPSITLVRKLLRDMAVRLPRRAAAATCLEN